MCWHWNQVCCSCAMWTIRANTFVWIRRYSCRSVRTERWKGCCPNKSNRPVVVWCFPTHIIWPLVLVSSDFERFKRKLINKHGFNLRGRCDRWSRWFASIHALAARFADRQRRISNGFVEQADDRDRATCYLHKSVRTDQSDRSEPRRLHSSATKNWLVIAVKWFRLVNLKRITSVLIRIQHCNATGRRTSFDRGGSSTIRRSDRSYGSLVRSSASSTRIEQTRSKLVSHHTRRSGFGVTVSEHFNNTETYWFIAINWNFLFFYLFVLEREKCTNEMLKREFLGIAIGGLSGGEAKQQFVQVIEFVTRLLPPNFPRYCMGVGFTIDMLICVALGVDMFDCVYPTRTARFGSALIDAGQKLNLKHCDMAKDFSVYCLPLLK